MKTADLIKELKLNGLSVFKINDAARITGKGKNYMYLLLSKSKEVMRAQNGTYYLPDTDPFEVASRIANPSYISLISAFFHYGLIDQVPNVIKVITTKRHKAIANVQNMRINFKTVKRSMLYGYHKERNVAIADIEKAIVDSLYLNEDTRYLKETVLNGTNAGLLDNGLLAKYADLSGSKTVMIKAKNLLGQVND